MPKSKEQNFRLRLIDETLRNRKFVKTADLVKLIKNQLGEDVSNRTVQKDIEAMKNDTRLAYDAPIEYDSKRKAYFYSEEGYTIANIALKEHEVNALRFCGARIQLYSNSGLFKDFSKAIQKVIDGVNLKQKLKLTTDPDLIIQTDTVIYESSSDMLEKILLAIDEKTNICFDYRKFNSTDEKVERIISPYILKEYKSRWYILGFAAKDNKIKTFALDRMENLVHTNGNYYQNKTFDSELYFKHCFGITAFQETPKTIKLQFGARQIEYVKSLPIHSTQKVISENKNRLIVSIKVIPSYELYEYILGKMPDIKVLSPKPVAEKVKQILSKALATAQ